MAGVDVVPASIPCCSEWGRIGADQNRIHVT